MSDTNPAFNEESLKASIEAMWGKYGAHADVFRHMLLTLRRYQAQDDAVYHLIRSARDLKDRDERQAEKDRGEWPANYVRPAEPDRESKVPDLMAALEKSLERIKSEGERETGEAL